MFFAVAFAAEAVAPVASSPVQDVLSALMQIVALILSGLIVVGGRLLLKKFNVEISDTQADVLRKHAKDAILFAEEWGAKKAELEKRVVAGAEMFTVGVNYLASKVPGQNPEELSKAIHAAIGGTKGIGASKTIGQ